MIKTSGIKQAGMWVVGGKFASRLIDFGLLLFLGRLLTPADFGLIALAMAPVFVMEAVLELPLAQAIMNHPNADEDTYDTAFTLSILRGLLLAGMMLIIAFPMASFYEEPRLVPLILALSIAPALRGSVSPKLADFMIKMNFRPIFIMDLAGKLAAFSIAALIAFNTQSYWAIALATITSPLVRNIASYKMAPYRPRFSLKDWPHFSDILGWNSLSQLLASINWQTDRLILGKSTTSLTLGRYTMAQEFSYLPLHIILQPLTSPIMSKLTSLKSERDVQDVIVSYNSNLFAIAAPVVCGIALLAEPLIQLTLGVKWFETGHYLSGLALAYLFQIPATPVNALALTKNKTVYIALRSFIEFGFRVPLLIIGVNMIGVWGAIYAIGIGKFITMISSIWIIHHLSGVRIRALVMPVVRYSVCLGAMWVVVTYASPDNWTGYGISQTLIGMIILSALGAIVYLGCVLVSWILAGKPKTIEHLLISKIRKIRR